MSKISFTPNASGTGTFTIASPNSNTNRTLTLPDADGALLAGAQAPFIPAAVSGATQALDVGAANFFDAGTLTADTTVSFTNVPTEARWTYVADVGVSLAYNIESAVYTNKYFSTVGQDVQMTSVAFNSDGTKMYSIGLNSDAVFQYTLSTAWDVNTASYDGVSFSISSQETTPTSLTFKPDGTKMYITGGSSDTVFQYSLSTAWDLSTASYDSVSYSVSAVQANPNGLRFKPDGTKMYVSGLTNDSVYQFSLSTPWVVSTASYDNASFSFASQESAPRSIEFNSDGTKIFMVGSSADTVFQYSLSTAWAVNTASYDSVSFPVVSQDSGPEGICFGNNGLFMYLTGSITDIVYQYATGVGYSLTIPASVQDVGAENVFAGDHISYTFYTLDGGTNVYLINEEVL